MCGWLSGSWRCKDTKILGFTGCHTYIVFTFEASPDALAVVFGAIIGWSQDCSTKIVRFLTAFYGLLLLYEGMPSSIVEHVKYGFSGFGGR